MKIIEKLWRARDARKQCISFEYYPPKSKDRWPGFYEKVKRMSRLQPDFIDVTWGTGQSSSLDSLEISQKIQHFTQIDTMMHLTCTHRTKDELYSILKAVRQSGMNNIMALRGNRSLDKPWEPVTGGLDSAAQLVDFMREAFRDYFCIAVAAYPEGHREQGQPPDPHYYTTNAYYAEIDYLKQKVDAGADFIVTQLCYDMDRLKQFASDCRDRGIKVPVIPGILPIHSFNVFNKIASFSASIPQEIHDRVRELTPETLGNYAIDLLSQQLDRLEGDDFCAVHLYTLNYEDIIARTLHRRGRC